MRRRVALLAVVLALALVASWLLPRLAVPPDRHALALRLLDAGRAEEAVHLFEDPSWRGVAEYRAGRYRRALGAFFLQEDVRNLYNMGNAYARLHEWPGAKAAYRKALDLDPGHADARHNLDLVLRAEALERRLLEERRSTRRAGRWRDGNRDDPEQGPGDGKTVRGADVPPGEVRPAAARPDAAGRSDRAGRAGEGAASRAAQAGPAPGSSADRSAEEVPAGVGAAAIRRESAQAAEVLLRKITDDPQRVLAARLRQAHRLRRESEGR